MKILYLDCGMGAAGDMLTAALLELLPEPDVFIKELNALGIPDVTFIKESSVKCGITGTHVRVMVNGVEETEHLHDHDHEHGNEKHYHGRMQQIEQIVVGLHLPETVEKNVLAVYALIAEAESYAHGVPVSDVHFHEVGAMDAVADITAVCMLMDRIAPDKVIVSPIHVGSGHVKCAHGILPVPAPATAHILQNVPIYGGVIKDELCTPTGAALLKHFAVQFGNMPIMRVNAIGYGMGAKDFGAANCVRAMLGETIEENNSVLELSCNVDDMTAEAVGFAMEILLDGGALDVYTVPIGMKKSRPGILLRVLCDEQNKEKMISLIFQHTTTSGIREAVLHRYTLEREIKALETPYGILREKTVFGYGVTRSKFEYDDLIRIAKEKGISMEEVKRLIRDIK